MTTFSFSSGNPANLVGGGTASMSDISGSLDDVKTFLNAATIDTTNLATSAKPVTLLGQWHTVTEIAAQYDDGDTSGIKLLVNGLASEGLQLLSNGISVGVGWHMFAIDPADYAVSGLTPKFRIRAAVATNATAPAITFTFGLHLVTTAGGADAITPTLAAAVSGSTVAIASPPASTATVGSAGSDFTPPTAGVYALAPNLSGTVATNSKGQIYIRLEVHHV